MRSPGLLVMLAACGGSGDGAVLSFTAPGGPGSASRIEVVLASADAESITKTRQRMRPGLQDAEDVVYYRQRSTGGAIMGIPSLEGFEIRIEPDETIVPDEAFIPFALIYDEADVLIAVGTVNDESGAPTTVMIKPGIVANYEVTVLALAPDVDAAGIGPGEGHAVACESEAGTWTSGAAWKRAKGPQIRLLLPDLAEDHDATDAMLRSSDLDCDEYPADSRDCDDLRTAYHAGQTETCDGQDTDCDGRRLELIEGCQPTNAACSATGVSLCAEGPNDNATAPATCLQTAACGCALVAGQRPAGCSFCALDWVETPAGSTAAGAAPCAPSAGKLHFEACAAPGCTIDVVGTDGQWEIKIAAEEVGPFSTQLTGITTNYYFLRAKYLGTATFPPTAVTIGAAYVAITPATVLGRPVFTPINLELSDQRSECSANPLGNTFMFCQP